MTAIERQGVIDSLSRLVTPGIKLTALADELGAHKQDYAALRTLLAELVEEGVAHVLPGGAYALAPMGRAANPSAKPVRAARPEPVRMAAKKPTPAPKQRQRTATLPWKKPPAATAATPHAVPPPRRLAPPPKRETYDPDTGETREEAAGIMGRITVHPAGYGFVATDAGETVFVPAKYRGHSLDGDRVVVDTWPGVKGTEGRVEEILSRGRARLTGILRRVGRAIYLEPDDPRIAADYGRVGVDDAPSGKDGDAIVVEITPRYPDAARRELAGKLLKVLGDPEDPADGDREDPRVRGHPARVSRRSDRAGVRDAARSRAGADLADRLDLRDRGFCTIDPETARRLRRRAVHRDRPARRPARVGRGRGRLALRALERRARSRGRRARRVRVLAGSRDPDAAVSTVGADRSLNPQVDRCAMVVRLDYNLDGTVQDVAFAAAVIRSKGRLDYPGVAAALEGDFRGRREQYRGWLEELRRLDALARVLRSRRQARGALISRSPSRRSCSMPTTRGSCATSSRARAIRRSSARISSSRST